MVMLRLCECGCGSRVNSTTARFISGHNQKTKDAIKMMTGNVRGIGPRTEEAKRNIRIGTFGKRKNFSCSEEARKKISKALKGKIVSEETRKRMSIVATGRKHTDESRNKMSESHSGKPTWNKGKRMSKEFCERMSEVRTQMFLDGIPSDHQYKNGYFFSNKNGCKVYHRSSYELLAYKILEQMSKVKSYDAEPFAIPYICNGKIKHTIPDILVTYTDESKELIEIKPNFLLEEPSTVMKIERMKFFSRKRGWDFSVWTEKELKNAS